MCTADQIRVCRVPGVSGDDPVRDAVATLAWLAAEGPPALAASALSALSLQSHDGVELTAYSIRILLLMNACLRWPRPSGEGFCMTCSCATV